MNGNEKNGITELSRLNMPLILALGTMLTLAGAIGGGGIVWGTTSARLSQLETQVTGLQKSLDTATQLLARIDERTSRVK